MPFNTSTTFVKVAPSCQNTNPKIVYWGDIQGDVYKQIDLMKAINSIWDTRETEITDLIHQVCHHEHEWWEAWNSLKLDYYGPSSTGGIRAEILTILQNLEKDPSLWSIDESLRITDEKIIELFPEGETVNQKMVNTLLVDEKLYGLIEVPEDENANSKLNTLGYSIKPDGTYKLQYYGLMSNDKESEPYWHDLSAIASALDDVTNYTVYWKNTGTPEEPIYINEIDHLDPTPKQPIYVPSIKKAIEELGTTRIANGEGVLCFTYTKPEESEEGLYKTAAIPDKDLIPEFADDHLERELKPFTILISDKNGEKSWEIVQNLDTYYTVNPETKVGKWEHEVRHIAANCVPNTGAVEQRIQALDEDEKSFLEFVEKVPATETEPEVPSKLNIYKLKEEDGHIKYGKKSSGELYTQPEVLTIAEHDAVSPEYIPATETESEKSTLGNLKSYTLDLEENEIGKEIKILTTVIQDGKQVRNTWANDETVITSKEAIAVWNLLKPEIIEHDSEGYWPSAPYTIGKLYLYHVIEGPEGQQQEAYIPRMSFDGTTLITINEWNWI